jgi:hypothetical protein
MAEHCLLLHRTPANVIPSRDLLRVPPCPSSLTDVSTPIGYWGLSTGPSESSAECGSAQTDSGDPRCIRVVTRISAEIPRYPLQTSACFQALFRSGPTLQQHTAPHPAAATKQPRARSEVAVLGGRGRLTRDTGLEGLLWWQVVEPGRPFPDRLSRWS